MQLLSREAELELLEKVGDHLAKRMELERQRDDNWDLISRSEVLEKLASQILLKYGRMGNTTNLPIMSL